MSKLLCNVHFQAVSKLLCNVHFQAVSKLLCNVHFQAVSKLLYNVHFQAVSKLLCNVHFQAVYFLFQPVLHDWCNKGRGMYYPVCGMVHIKEPLLLIDKSSLCGGSGFHFSLSEWSLTICLTPYNRR